MRHMIIRVKPEDAKRIRAAFKRETEAGCFQGERVEDVVSRLLADWAEYNFPGDTIDE